MAPLPFSHVHNQKGLSIIEGLIGISMLGIVIVGATGMMSFFLGSSNYLEFKTSVPFFMEGEVRESLKDPTACLVNFGGLDPNVVTSIETIKNGANQTMYTKGGSYYGGLVKISDSFQFGRTPSAGTPAVGPNSSGATELIFKLAPARHATGGPQAIARVLRVMFTTDANTKVNYCTVESRNNNQMQGTPVGAPIVINQDNPPGPSDFDYTETIDLSAYPLALGVHYTCKVGTHSPNSNADVILKFQTAAGQPIYDITGCHIQDVGLNDTAIDSRMGMVPIPVTAGRIVVELKTMTCAQDCTNNVSLQFFQ